MAWVRIDDQAPRNQKMLKAGPAACWLWVCGIAHCQSQLTDGFISLEVLPMIGVLGVARVTRLAETLVEAGLFERTDGGFLVHGYLDLNLSRAEVVARRAEDADRKKRESAKTPRGIQPESRVPRARVPSHPIPSHPPASPDQDALIERAGRLIERYAELFYQHQKGAKYHNRMHLDFPKACELVQTWSDDERLEKLAVLILTTDDEWIAGTDRGFSVFAAKASWADARLAKWEADRKVGTR